MKSIFKPTYEHVLNDGIIFIAPRSLETNLRGISIQMEFVISESINIPVVHRRSHTSGRLGGYARL